MYVLNQDYRPRFLSNILTISNFIILQVFQFTLTNVRIFTRHAMVWEKRLRDMPEGKNKKTV